MRPLQAVFIVLLLSASAALQAMERALPEPGPVPWQPTDRGEVERSDTDRGAGFTVGPNALACDYTDLQAAIDDVANGSVILLARNMNHTGRSYVINQRSLTIRGGYANCASATASGRTTIDVGSNNAPVITVANNVASNLPSRTVHLENLVLRGASGVSGRGLLVSGTAGRLQVNLRNMLISNNQGLSGAGIRAETGGVALTNLLSPFLSIDNSSEIRGNTASGDGGGIELSCVGQGGPFNGTMLRMGSTLVHENSAANGGAVAVQACRGIFIYGGAELTVLGNKVAGIFDNHASNRGGVFHGSEGAEINVLARAFGGFGDASQAVLIRGNSAGARGGVAAISGQNSILYLENSYLLGNQADIAGVIYVDEQARVDVGRFPTDGSCEPVKTVFPAIVYPPCSVIADNQAGEYHSVAMARTNSELNLSQTRMSGNIADITGLIGVGNLGGNPDLPATRVRIEGSVIHDNRGNVAPGGTTSHLIDVSYGGQLRLIHSTIANNQLHAAALRIDGWVGQQTQLRINSSIILEQRPILIRIGNAGIENQMASLDCVIGNRSPTEVNQSFDVRTFYSQIDAGFVNAAQRNYRLRDDSPAIDYCDNNATPLHPDFDGNERGVPWLGGPLTPAPNPVPGGIWDIGAFEAQPDRLFRDRFQ